MKNPSLKYKETIKALRSKGEAYCHWMSYISELAINAFKWENLPDTVDERYLEKILFETSAAAFFYDDIMNEYVVTTVALNGKWNIYNIPINRTAYASNSFHRQLTIDNSVIIFNNYLHTAGYLTALYYANQIADLDVTISNNAYQQNALGMILCDESQVLTMKNMFAKYDGRIPVIFGNKATFDKDNINHISFGVEFKGKELEDLKRIKINECLTCYGIENKSSPTSQRPVTSEITTNMGEIEAARNVLLNARKQACDQINKMFDLNISVSFRTNLTTNIPNEEGEEYVNLYDAT